MRQALVLDIPFSLQTALAAEDGENTAMVMRTAFECETYDEENRF